MGNAMRRHRRPYRGLMLGLDGAGKTTILYRMLHGTSKEHLFSEVLTVPTIGFNCELLDIGKGVRLQTWDIGGQDTLRPLWKHYYEGTHAVVWIVDSGSPSDLLQKSAEELHAVMGDELLKDAALLVLANKDDLAYAPLLPADLRLHDLGCPWHLQPTVGTTGVGMREGFAWLAAVLKRTKRKK